ncbi:sensor histidine kinase [Nonomuraea soli]|uniref:histidine kinase n=1 Tax=Nonomuraea soli TaxID=1032476 RepID=A0A7W0CRA3_9ACTN|nr:ATP-binding protein [Nonomuraea soli]MBA2895876.1 signal transduction histidine kinase [Nonomuraea soli]
MSARFRIVGWMLAVVGLALAVAISAGWAVLVQREAEVVNDELRNEVDKLRGFAAQRPVRDLDELFDAYLQVNVADRWETFFTLVDGRWHGRSPDARAEADPRLIDRIARHTQVATGSHDEGTIRWAAIPVSVIGDARQGHFVILVFYDRHRAEVDRAVRLLVLSALGALALAGAAGWFVAGRVLSPVRLVRTTAERISDSSDLSQRLTVTGNDDVAALARTFNHMLDRLERAFAIQREFLDDAGHELRTPITVVRGHLELMGATDEEREETLALVTDELDRMSRIVEDLLTLAKAEQPGFLAIEEVEVADLTVSVVAKARALGERRWRVDSLAEVSIMADRQRLTQALMQLAANAFRHTAEGGEIAVGSAVQDGRVTLWVRDDGPGVPDDDRERIFQRFVRVGSSPGAGLGLAIVRSIAEAHGGTVHVEDGARFVITVEGTCDEPDPDS